MIASTEERLMYLMNNMKPGWKNTHEIEVQKKLLALLKKYKKDPQIDLFEESKKTNNGRKQ